MSYTEWKDGYAIETTFKDGTTINDNADPWFLIGAISEESVWPSPTFSVSFAPTGVNAREAAAGALWKGQAHLRGMLGITVQNGVICWLAMGKSTTTDDAPAATYNTHAIAPTTDGSLLPSVVFQHEEKGGATNEEYQFQGVKFDSLVLSHDMSQGAPNVLLAKAEIMAGYAMDPTFAMTADPALPPTANTQPFMSLTRSWDINGTPVSLDGLQSVDISIINAIEPLYAHSYDTGVYTGQWPYAFGEAARKMYRVDMILAKNTIERALWTELIAASNTKDASFKWARHATNDYIKVTVLDCQVAVHEIKTPPNNEDLVAVELIPTSMTVEVVDQLEGASYGE